jgi:outer membrane protein assembly factor BamB
VIYIGSGDDRVYALNATTGAKLWSHHTGNQVFSSPTVANGVVYVGSGDGNMYAFGLGSSGATTAEVKVVTPGGTLSSNVPFQVP